DKTRQDKARQGQRQCDAVTARRRSASAWGGRDTLARRSTVRRLVAPAAPLRVPAAQLPEQAVALVGMEIGHVRGLGGVPHQVVELDDVATVAGVRDELPVLAADTLDMEVAIELPALVRVALGQGARARQH